MSLAVGLMVWALPTGAPLDRVWGSSTHSHVQMAISAGYFLWDLSLCLLYPKVFGVGYTLHAVRRLSGALRVPSARAAGILRYTAGAQVFCFTTYGAALMPFVQVSPLCLPVAPRSLHDLSLFAAFALVSCLSILSCRLHLTGSLTALAPAHSTTAPSICSTRPAPSS